MSLKRAFFMGKTLGVEYKLKSPTNFSCRALLIYKFLLRKTTSQSIGICPSTTLRMTFWYLEFPFLYNHRQLNAFTVFIDFGDFYFNVLVEFDYFVDIAYETSFELGNVYQTAFFDSNIDKATKIGDVVYDSGQNHPGFQIFNGFDIRVEFKDFGRFSWV
jgi:hypothetical protein